jgi:hypothetical protein
LYEFFRAVMFLEVDIIENKSSKFAEFLPVFINFWSLYVTIKNCM